MLLLDAIYINNGGGLVLLKELINILEIRKENVFYLLDDRVKEEFNFLNAKNVLFKKNSMVERFFFYYKNKEKFKSILCFGNVPPPISVEAKVYVYFHQKLYLEIPDNFNLKNKFVFNFKKLIFNFLKYNADYWVVQSNLIKKQLGMEFFCGNVNNIVVCPFYPPLNFSGIQKNRVSNSFIYVSNSGSHKNHINLITAFCSAYDKMKKGSLLLTVPSEDFYLCNFINDKVQQGYPINNVGFVERRELAELYMTNQYLIFPSFSESLGLGLAEAVDGGCKVIASNLPYTFQVCEPSLTFDPFNEESIENAIIRAVNENLPSSKKNITNDINQLITLLME